MAGWKRWAMLSGVVLILFALGWTQMGAKDVGGEAWDAESELE